MYRYFCLLIAGWILLMVLSCNQSSDSPDPEVPPDPDLGGVTETGNPLQGGEVVFLSYSTSEFDTPSNLRTVKGVANDAVAVVSEAYLVVKEMTFEDDEGCPELTFPTQWMVLDLLTIMNEQEERDHGDGKDGLEECHPTMNMTFGPLIGPASGVDSILGQRLLGFSLLIRIEGVTDLPIEFRGRQEWERRFREPEEWIDPDSGENLIVGFNRDSWSQGIDLRDSSYPVVIEGGESLLVVDSEEYPQVLDLLIQNALDSMNIFVDANGNRELDREEYLNPVPHST